MASSPAPAGGGVSLLRSWEAADRQERVGDAGASSSPRGASRLATRGMRALEGGRPVRMSASPPPGTASGQRGLSPPQRGGHNIADDGQVRSRRKAHLPVVPIASRPLTVDNTTRRRSPTDQPAPSPKGASSLRRSLPQHLHQLRASTAPSPEPSTIPGASRGQQRCSTAAQPGGAGNRGRFLSTPQASVLSGNRRTKTVQRGVVMPLNQSAPIVEETGSDEDFDASTTQRVMNLPTVVCRSADGDVYLVETSNVQNKRIRRQFGKDLQKKGRDKLYNLMSAPGPMANWAWRDGYMDIGKISHEPTEDELHVEGEDGDWEAAHLNQKLYREFRSLAPEYVDTRTKLYQNGKDREEGPRIDFEHWRLLRAIEKEDAGNSPARRTKVAAHQSWAPKRGRHVPDGTEAASTSTPPSKPGVSFGRSASKPVTTEQKRLEAKSMTLPEIEFDFDGEQIRMAVAPQKNGLQRKPSKPPSGVSRAITLGPGSMRRNAMEPEGAIQEEEGHRAGEKVRDDASMTDEQRQAAAAAERQFRRLQRWEQQIFTGRPAKQQVPRPALRPAGSPPKPRNPSAMSRAKGPNPSAGTGRHVGKLLTKLRGQLGTRYRKQTVMQFKQKDPLSLVNAAMERQTKRETLTEEWDRRKQAQRPGAVPVPTPPELPDEEIIKERPKTAVRVRRTADGDSEEITPAQRQEPFLMDEASRKKRQEELKEQLRQFEELEALVKGHEDFNFTGSKGKPSALIQQLRKGYEAVAASNSLAFDEFEARDAEETYRLKAETARMYEMRFETEPNNNKTAENFFYSLEDLISARPYFKLPAANQLRDKYERRPWSLACGGEQALAKPAWSLEKSVFLRRKQESDSKDFFDTPKLLERQVEIDWMRVVAKKRFVKLIRMSDIEIAEGHQNINEELEEINQVVMNNYMTIRSAFIYFCAKGSNIGEACFTMKVNNWNTFCRDVGIMDPLSATCNSGALNAMFLATNYEDGDAMSQREQEENADNALMRFEWIEILVRVSIAKFIQDKHMTDDISTAMEYLCRYHLDTMPPEATLDVNIFRRQRFYNEDMDFLLRKYANFLESVFRCYKAKNSSKYFWMEHWMTLLDTLQLVGDRTSIGTTQAKLIYLWSKTGCVDELRRRQRVVSWQFLDFLEGLARLAEAISLPTQAELEELIQVQERRKVSFTYTGHCRQWEYMKKVNVMVLRKHRRPSFGIIKSIGITSTRPLAEKMEAFIGYILAGLCETWNVEVGNMDKLTNKLNAMAVMLGGGIELS